MKFISDNLEGEALLSAERAREHARARQKFLDCAPAESHLTRFMRVFTDTAQKNEEAVGEERT